MSWLEGKTIAVTGAAGGIGTLLVTRLRQAGATVCGIDRIACAGCDQSIVADLAAIDGLADVSKQLAQKRIDILVNVAGMQYFGPFERQGAGDLALGYTINLIVPAVLARAVIPGMRARGLGQIVNIGSVMAAINYPYFAAYSSAKAGLKGLSEALRRELHDSGIGVTYIAPRAVRTGFNNAAVNTFLALSKMTADEPAWVADRIAQAIAARRKDVAIGAAERFYCAVNALLPRIVDAGLSGQAAKARRLFSS